jgi:transcriptional regulator with XRE-family HTH domain
MQSHNIFTCLRAQRKLAALTQAELAELASVDLSTISHIERWGTFPTPKVRQSLARALGISPAALLTDDLQQADGQKMAQEAIPAA